LLLWKLNLTYEGTGSGHLTNVGLECYLNYDDRWTLAHHNIALHLA